MPSNTTTAAIDDLSSIDPILNTGQKNTICEQENKCIEELLQGCGEHTSDRHQPTSMQSLKHCLVLMDHFGPVNTTQVMEDSYTNSLYSINPGQTLMGLNFLEESDSLVTTRYSHFQTEEFSVYRECARNVEIFSDHDSIDTICDSVATTSLAPQSEAVIPASLELSSLTSGVSTAQYILQQVGTGIEDLFTTIDSRLQSEPDVLEYVQHYLNEASNICDVTGADVASQDPLYSTAATCA